MKTHNANIYHCISCGRVEHAVADAQPPQCCGQKMVKAGAETILEDAGSGDKPAGNAEPVRPITKGRTKPR